jgi:5'-methylthioadenosine phosphorylase
MSTSRVWPPVVSNKRADIGVFGGSGFYEFLTATETITVDTPYGTPSDKITIGMVGDRRVAFLPRHGHSHSVVAHAVNYRANMWALHSLGISAVISPFSCGSLRAELEPGHMVVVDDLVDRTWARADTFFDGSDGVVNHVTFGHPYSESLRGLAVEACRSAGITTHDGGTVVVINGPRFSTRAESRWFSAMGWSVVNMTQYPEAVLAAELGLPIVGIALVTDFDAGLEGAEGIHGKPVTMDDVFATMKANVANVRDVITRLIPAIPLG